VSAGGVSALDLTAIEARLNAATPGPWRAKQMNRPEHDPWFFVLDAAGRGPVVETVVAQTKYLVGPEEQQRADVEFIAHAPSDIAVLVEHVKALRAALAPSNADLIDIGVQLGGFEQARSWFARRAAAVLGEVPGERPAP